MDIDFIKWMCDKAEWFDYLFNHRNEEYVNCPDSEKLFVSNGLDTYQGWDEVYYPLLLQRAIEGVNVSRGIIASIDVSRVTLEKWDENEYITGFYLDEMSIDQAKETALKYIYEQEKNIG